jgi:hypothetical protein
MARFAFPAWLFRPLLHAGLSRRAHHPLCPLTPLGFSDSIVSFFAAARLPSINDSLQFNCWRSFDSLRNASQISNQTCPWRIDVVASFERTATLEKTAEWGFQ